MRTTARPKTPLTFTQKVALHALTLGFMVAATLCGILAGAATEPTGAHAADLAPRATCAVLCSTLSGTGGTTPVPSLFGSHAGGGGHRG